MLTKRTALFAVLLFGLSGCPRPAKPPPLPPKPTLKAVMQGAEKSRQDAKSADNSLFASSMKAVSEAMKVTRDGYSPDPAFYRLADEAASHAQESAERALQNDLSGATSAQQEADLRCQQCHARYGGPTSQSQPHSASLAEP